MAIDTPAKRASALGFMLPFIHLIPPDGSINAADRKTLGSSYGGIAADTPFVPVQGQPSGYQFVTSIVKAIIPNSIK